MFALTMRGMQKSLIIGLIGAVISTAIAAVAGAAAGYFSGWTDRAIIALIDLLLVLPGFLIIAILSPVFEGRTWLIFVLLLAAFQWMITARVIRSMTLSMKEREFVYAARFMGVSDWKIILRHILPNMSSFPHHRRHDQCQQPDPCGSRTLLFRIWSSAAGHLSGHAHQ